MRQAMQTEHEVFAEALSFPEPAARTEYLDRICGTDQMKRQRLNELLKLHESAGSVLDRRPNEMIESLTDDGDDDGDTVDSTVPSLDHVLKMLLPFLEPATQPDSLGRLGHYELLEILGQGGYGIVFKAMDTRLSRLVAVKILSPHLATTSPPRRRFLREARAAAAVRHENVVQIYAVEESPIPHLVMEFVSGETLQQRSDRMGPLEPAEVIRLGQQIARGLAAAHAQGLIHRDIKPCNILIADGIEPVAKLSDFGLARTVDDASMSQSGIVIGTPMYMSPEQVTGEEVDQRTDLFSFGSVLYLMAAGRPPFRATSTLAVLKRVAEDRPRSIRDVISDVPEGLCRLIARLHSKEREDRFSTAKDVESALGVCLIETKPTLSRRLQQFLMTRSGRITSAVMILLLVGVVISESLGQTDFIARTASLADVKSNPTSINQAAASDVAALPGNVPAPELTLVPSVGLGPVDSASRTPEPANTTIAKTTLATKVETNQEMTPETVDVPTKQPVDAVFLSNWDKAVGLMSAEDQAEAVRAKLKQLNPGFDLSGVNFSIEEGVIRELRIYPALMLADITPLRALRSLKTLRIMDRGICTNIEALRGLPLEHLEIVGTEVRDLSPLKGMPLTYLGIWPFAGDDLSPLRGMKLKDGNLGGGTILRDLEPLRGMPLESFCLNHTDVHDLSPLAGMPLKRLEIQNTKVKDLTPLAGAPLEFLAFANTEVTDLNQLQGFSKLSELRLDADAARDKTVLKGLPELKTINGVPAAEFLANP